MTTSPNEESQYHSIKEHVEESAITPNYELSYRPVREAVQKTATSPSEELSYRPVRETIQKTSTSSSEVLTYRPVREAVTKNVTTTDEELSYRPARAAIQKTSTSSSDVLTYRPVREAVRQFATAPDEGLSYRPVREAVQHIVTTLKNKHDRKVSSVMSCALCNNELKKPKILPCQHSFCTNCLFQHRDLLGKGGPFPFCCPTCRTSIQLKDDTVESLPNNYLYDIVKEVDGRMLYSNLECCSCTQMDKASNARYLCLDCGDAFCEECKVWHCRFTATKHHAVVSLSDLEEGNFQDEFSTRKVLYCDVHTTDEHKVPLSSYCDKCRMLVCVDCIQGYHKGHDVTKIHTVREKHQKSSDESFSYLLKSKCEQDRRIMNIEKSFNDTRQKWRQQETEIYNTNSDIHDMVDRIKTTKLNRLTEHYKQELQFINYLLIQERNKQSRLDATVAFTTMFREKCSDSDFLNHEDDIKKRIESSQRRLSEGFKRNLLTVKKQETESLTHAIGDVFGKIKLTEKCCSYSCKIGQVKEKFKRKVGTNDIGGLSYNNKEIFVASRKDDQGIHVMDEDGIFKRIIRCKNANRSGDMDVKNSHIFYAVYTRNMRKIVMMDYHGTVTQCIMLPDDDQGTNYQLGIVVDDDGTSIFIASNVMHRIYKWVPYEDKLTTIISPEMGHDIKRPTYLCLTPGGQLVVSNSGSSNIQAYSKDGIFQWQYDGKEEGHTLKNPRGICCDEDGYIYVADKANGTIQIIHGKKFIGIIPMKQELTEQICVPLISTPGGDLIYGYKNNLIKISFWE